MIGDRLDLNGHQSTPKIIFNMDDAELTTEELEMFQEIKKQGNGIIIRPILVSPWAKNQNSLGINVVTVAQSYQTENPAIQRYIIMKDKVDSLIQYRLLNNDQDSI